MIYKLPRRTYHRINSRLLKITCLVFTYLLLNACNWSSDSNSTQPSPIKQVPIESVPVETLALNETQNCDELKQYVINSLIEQYTAVPQYEVYYCGPEEEVIGGGNDSVSPPPSMDAAPAPAAPGEPSNKSGPDTVSDTNNQEDGVNEGDIVKTASDGTMYIIRNTDLFVTRGFPPQEMVLLKQFALQHNARELFLDEPNNRLIVIIEQAHYYLQKPIDGGLPTVDPVIESAFAPVPYYTNKFAIQIYDIATPAETFFVKQIGIDGNYVTARHIAERLHIVSSSYLQTDEIFNDAQFWQLHTDFQNAVRRARCQLNLQTTDEILNEPNVSAAKQAFSNNVSNTVAQMDINSILPKAMHTQDDMSTDLPFLQCGDIFHPGVNNRFALQLLTSLDTNGDNVQSTGIVNYAGIFYASEQHMYLVENNENWFWASNDGNSAASQSVIYQFGISQNKPDYLATGRVDGTVRNQFSLSEFNNTLRVATTQRTPGFTEDGNTRIWQWEVTNHLFTLQRNENDLNITGEVRDYGKGESIQSARFYGNKGFVVTFLRIDPLFTFDLSNPADPQLKGELEIPGFSEYIHQYDENHLITVGRAGNANGATNQVQIQLFDVSDLENPSQLKSLIPSSPDGWSWSAAEYDHKAFTFDKNTNLLAIPMSIHSYDGTGFNGIVAFHVDLNGITELGRIDHQDLARESYCGDINSQDYLRYGCDFGAYVWYAAPRRSVVMTKDENVYLYTISEAGVKSNSIDNFTKSLNSIVFPPWQYVNVPMPLAFNK